MSPQDGLAALGRQLHEGACSAVELAQRCLERIERLDPELGAFVTVNPHALTEAAGADRRIAAGRAGPLTGIPVAVKDNLLTTGLETTCCSRVLEGFVPVEDATAVARLRAAGAVVLGKTNMDEFGMGSSTESSARGPSRNPWAPDRVPGGSSGGSAVAVATGMAPLALGSDTGGSIRQPAAFCGVVGLKPTYGRVSRSGLVAYGSSLDQVGPLATRVADVATALETLAGADPRDATAATAPVDRYAEACSAGADGLRVGLPREYFGAGLDPAVAAGVRRAAEALVAAGATVEEVSLPHTRYAIPTYYLIATAEASSNLARYDGVRFGRRVDTGGGLRSMIRASRGSGFGIEVQRRIMLGTYGLSAGYYDQFYGKALRARTLIRGDFLARFAEGFDLLLTPTTPTPAFPLGAKLDDPLEMYLSDIFTVTANLAGLPALALPVGTDPAGLPVGAQLIGPDFSEATLFAAGAAIEAACPPPTMGAETR